MSNNYGSNIYLTADNYRDIKPIDSNNAQDMNAAKNGTGGDSPYGSRDLDLNAQVWGGMQTGAILYDSTQSHNWLSTVPKRYKELADKWQNQQGVIKITPLQQRQKFTYATIAYIASNQAEPKTQVLPLTDLSVTPHQINWDFYSTTEGRVGVSNAIEEHMKCEFDIYLTDLVASYWAFGGDGQYDYGLSIFPNLKKEWWNSVKNGTYLQFEKDIEKTTKFIQFRNSFLQQHMGWVCRFNSPAFGIFQGVINQVTYDIGGGESFAKWHVTIEEAIFLNDAYSTTGQKPDETENSSGGNSSTTSSDGSSTASGDATSTEDIDTGE